MKKAIRYLRFSQIGQSNGSIERQELYTDQWLKNNNVELVDTFIDRGKSATTFDRPDFIKLQEFIRQHYKFVDYLLVDQMDRFSRDAGEAMSLVKNLQKLYSIQVVSVTEGIIFDYDTPGSFFRAGLQLLLAEEDNINRSIKIRGGLYTARAKEGRYLSSTPPFGYRREGEGKARGLVIHEQQAKVVKFVFDSYLRDVPVYIIKERALGLGFKMTGKTAVERMLANPVYAAMLKVGAYKEYTGGLFPAIHEPIIDFATWQIVQNKMKKPNKVRVVIDEELPLRGILKCHCGNFLTGAPSRGKSGKYFYYYKCRESKHNNISAIKAHDQFLEICDLMSLPIDHISEIRSNSVKLLEKELQGNKKRLADQKILLKEVEDNLLVLEGKWLKDQITRDTYDKWYDSYRNSILELKASIERLSKNKNGAFKILEKNLDKLADIRFVYESVDILKKREFVNMVFDGNLYYQNGSYRTPTMMPALSRNSLVMSKKKKYYF